MLTNDDFGAWWRATEAELRRTLRTSQVSGHEIDDICQDTAALAWRRRGSIGSSQADLVRWAVVVARRLLWRRRSRSARQQPTDPEYLVARGEADPIDPERIALARSHWETVVAAINELPSSERSAVLGRLHGASTGPTKRQQDAAAAALARARRRLGRLGALGPVWRRPRTGRAASPRTRLAVGVASAGVVTAAMVGLPVAVLVTSLSAPSPLPAYGQPIGFSASPGPQSRPAVSHAMDAPPPDEAPSDDGQSDDLVRQCVRSIVSTLGDVGAEARWANIAEGVAGQAGLAVADRLPILAQAPAAGAHEAPELADLERRARELLASFTTAEIRIVCQEVERAASVVG